MDVELRPGGLFLPALDLWLDPDRPVPRAFVSHAHGDHAGGAGSGTVFGSPETLALLAVRRGMIPGELPVGWDESVELSTPSGPARIMIAPAGHVLGAAQLVVDHGGGRLVYTGDYRTGPGETHLTGAPIACDTLIVESTFGLPIFRFPERAATIAALVVWCRQTLEAGDTPVVLAYALGKSQAIVHALLAADLPVVAHGAVHKICVAYESLGVPMGIADGRTRAYADAKSSRAVLVTPPDTVSQPMIKKRRDAKVAYVSGWAMIDAAVDRHRADAAFAISDHADFDDLVATVDATGAREVVVTHGEALPFSWALAARGGDRAVTALATRALDESEQTESP